MDFESRGARLTMDELRGECHKYGLSANGLRLALEKRLKEYKDATYKPPSEGLQMTMASGASTTSCLRPALTTPAPRNHISLLSSSVPLALPARASVHVLE